MKRFTNINTQVIPLSDEGIDPPEKLPPIHFIDLSGEEYQRLIGKWFPPIPLTIDEVNEMLNGFKNDDNSLGDC